MALSQCDLCLNGRGRSGHRDTHAGSTRVEMKAEMRLVSLRAQEPQRQPADHREPERGLEQTPSEPPEHPAGPHLVLDLASRAVRQRPSVV